MTQQNNVQLNNVTFQIPSGWVGQETEGSYYMQSESGLYYLVMQEVPFESMEHVQQEFNSGIEGDDGSVGLVRSSEFETISSKALGAAFSSDDINSSVNMYGVGVFHSAGRGVIVLAGHTSGEYSTDYAQVCKQVAQSIQFNQPVRTSGKASGKTTNKTSKNAFERKYGNTRLTYIESYYSSGYGDMGGGYRQKIIIDLCGRGYFNYSDNTELGGGGSSSTFIGNDGSSGNGTWSIQQKNRYEAVLMLNFYNGEVYTFDMELNDADETYLNGYRYYRTGSDDDYEYQPDCF